MKARVKVEIIGAGWGRTGTSTFQKAIEILGFGPCYHMNENWDNGDARQWTNIADRTDDSNLHEILGGNGYRASCDFPAAVYWKEQLEMYPDSKVVLTYRDPEIWYRSFIATIANLQPDNEQCPFGVRVMFGLGLPCIGATEMLHKVITRDCFDNDWSKENIIRAYTAHIDDVKLRCPPEKLLVYDVTQGWEPLCQFLGKPIPTSPFPHVNTTSDFESLVNRMSIVGTVVAVAGLGIPALLSSSRFVDRTERRPPHMLSTMLAATYSENKLSGYDTLTVRCASTPRPKPGYAVVRVVCASINPLDFKLLRGYVKRMGWSMPQPFTPGYDFSGVVAALHSSDCPAVHHTTAHRSSEDGEDEDEDEDVHPRASTSDSSLFQQGVPVKFSIGDHVLGINFGQGSHDDSIHNEHCPVGGAFAEYILVPLVKLTHKPASVSFHAAASVPLAGLTAYQVLHDCAKVTAGSRVLILGGSSVVGLIAIQLAKRAGAWVVTTASTRNIAFVRQFGADKIINYQESKWESYEETLGVDVVIDAVGDKDSFQRMKSIVKPTGVYVSIASFDAGSDPLGHPPMTWCAKYGVCQQTEQLTQLVALLESGDIKIPIHKEFPLTLSGVRDIFAEVEAGKSTGKNILRISKY